MPTRYDVIVIGGGHNGLTNGDHLWRTNDHAQTRRELLKATCRPRA